MPPKKHLKKKCQTTTQDSGQKEKYAENFYCHLCRITFEDSFSLCMHIMKKHRPSSKFYEGDNDSETEREKQNGEILETSCNYENSQDLNISTSLHQTSEEANKNDQVLGNSLRASLPVSLEATCIRTEQASSSSESLLQDQIYQNIILQCNRHDTQEKGPQKFDYTYENILKWQETFQNKFASLQFPWPGRVLTTMKVVLGILYKFCELSTDKKAVSITKEVIEQMEDILKRHENM